jgi:multidrug efflux system membrane fusion protein
MVLTLDDSGRVGLKAVGEGNRVEFHPARILAGDEDGVWLTGLPSSIRAIVVGQEFVIAGETVEPVPAERAERRAGSS